MSVSGDLDPRTSRRARHAEDAGLFRLLVDRVVDYANFLLTPDGHVASWNKGAERLKGYRADEIIGHSFERFHPPEDRAAGLPQRLLATPGPRGGSSTRAGASGRTARASGPTSSSPRSGTTRGSRSGSPRSPVT